MCHAIDGIASTDLFDAAFAGAKESAGLYARAERKALRERLVQQFPGATRSAIARARDAALGLRVACYAVGEACRNEAISYEAAAEKLAEQFPGFSAAVYSEAVGYGMFVSR